MNLVVTLFRVISAQKTCTFTLVMEGNIFISNIMIGGVKYKSIIDTGSDALVAKGRSAKGKPDLVKIKVDAPRCDPNKKFNFQYAQGRMQGFVCLQTLISEGIQLKKVMVHVAERVQPGLQQIQSIMGLNLLSESAFLLNLFSLKFIEKRVYTLHLGVPKGILQIGQIANLIDQKLPTVRNKFTKEFEISLKTMDIGKTSFPFTRTTIFDSGTSGNTLASAGIQKLYDQFQKILKGKKCGVGKYTNRKNFFFLFCNNLTKAQKDLLPPITFKSGSGNLVYTKEKYINNCKRSAQSTQNCYLWFDTNCDKPQQTVLGFSLMRNMVLTVDGESKEFVLGEHKKK